MPGMPGMTRGLVLGVALCNCTPATPNEAGGPGPAASGPPSVASSSRRQVRYAAAEQAVLLRAIWLEASEGRRIVYSHPSHREPHHWVESTSNRLCGLIGCSDGCTMRIALRRPHCGTGLGEGVDFVMADAWGCGADEEYEYAVRYDPLTLSDAEEERELIEEIPEEEP